MKILTNDEIDQLTQLEPDVPTAEQYHAIYGPEGRTVEECQSLHDQEVNRRARRDARLRIGVEGDIP